MAVNQSAKPSVGVVGSQTNEYSERRLVVILTSVFFAGLTVILLLPLFSKASWLIFVQDDFLYYLKVAQSVASGRGSTFNGLVPTNGYQPLWFMVLVGVSWITNNARAILAFLALSNLLGAAATFFLAKKILAGSEAGALPVFALSGWVTLYSVTLFFYGMEVTLTVPLMLAVLCLFLKIRWVQRGWLHAFVAGLLLSAMVLSRIDTLIFGGLILGGILCSAHLRRLIRYDLMLGAGLGLTPLLIYFLLNRRVFHTWLPVSGMAKELRRSHMPSIEPWRVFFHPLAAGFTTVILFAAVLLWSGRKRFFPIERALFAATLAFPFLYYFVLSCVSDWTLWGWYMYPIRPALCVSFLIYLRWARLHRLFQMRVVQAALVVSVFGCLTLLRWTRQQTDIYAASVEIADFAQKHPGVYAMGDRAGRVAYLIPDPIVQTEGLMMDRSYLRYVEREVPLRETLANYGVHYYVATAYEPFSGCFHAAEPAKAGPDSAKMRAEFCEEPVARYMHDGIETLIYDLGHARGF